MKTLFKKKRITGILEIGKAYLKLALVEEDFKGGKTVTKLAAGKLDEKNLILNSYPLLLECDDLIIILSRNQVTVRNLELPTTDPQEIKDIISIQAGKQTPFSRDEIIADFKTIGLTRQHYTKVLLAIVQRTTVNNFLNNLAEKKEAVSKIVLGSQVLVNWCSIIAPEIGVPVKNEISNGAGETFAVLDISNDFSDFCVFSKGKLLFTKLLHFGRRDLSKRTWQKSFLEELGLSLDAYRKESIGPTFNKVAIMGMNPEEKFNQDMKSALAGQVSLEALGPFEDAEGISISNGARAVLNEERKKGVSFSKLIGLALNPDRPLMDFLPQGLKQARLKRIKRKELMLTGILAFLVLIMGLGIFLEKIYTKTLLLRRLDAQFVKLEDGTSELKKEYLKINLIKNRMDTKNSALEVLREIHKVVPQEIYLTNISFEEGKLISLRGTLKAMSEVFKFVKTLEELPIFKNVKTKYVTKRRLKGKDLTDFEITCPLNQD